MQSTFIAVIVLVLAGIFGGNAAGLAIKEYNLGAIKNTFAGAVGGAAGYFLLAFIPSLRVMAEISSDFIGRLGLGCRKLHGERGAGAGHAIDR
jgi:uncharacterized membrane protein YeaQ/YmgE (transglycosylase-associated protein family)